MEETVLGIQVVRQAGADRQAGTIRLMKSWPDGARCLMLELLDDEVPVRGARFSFEVPWRKLSFKGGPYCLFDPESDWWEAPSDVDSILLWTKSHEPPDALRVAPRQASP